MKTTRQAAKELGVSLVTLQRYIAAGKVTPPKLTLVQGTAGKGKIRFWTPDDIERARKEMGKKK
jgi:DNA-binding transcriptional MerR regulator